MSRDGRAGRVELEAARLIDIIAFPVGLGYLVALCAHRDVVHAVQPVCHHVGQHLDHIVARGIAQRNETPIEEIGSGRLGHLVLPSHQQRVPVRVGIGKTARHGRVIQQDERVRSRGVEPVGHLGLPVRGEFRLRSGTDRHRERRRLGSGICDAAEIGNEVRRSVRLKHDLSLARDVRQQTQAVVVPAKDTCPLAAEDDIVQA